MKRRSFTLLLATAPAASLWGRTATDLMSDPSDRATWSWLLQRFGERETVKMKKGEVSLIGMTNKSPYEVGIMLDEQGRVVKARFNGAGFTNDEWPRLAGFRHLLDLTCWHNNRIYHRGEERPDLSGPHQLSGEGLIAFRDHPLQGLNMGGSSFNNLGLSTVAKLPNFRRIRAYHTRVDDKGLARLEGNETLRYLNVGPQFSMRITESSLEPIGRMKALRYLDFNETYVTWSTGLEKLLPLRDQLLRVRLEKTWVEEGCLEKARRAFPKTTFEHRSPNRQQIDVMKQRMEAARAQAGPGHHRQP